MSLDRPQALPAQAVLAELKTSPAGLSSREARTRLARAGSNVLEEETVSRTAVFLEQLQSPLVYVLAVAALLSLFISDWKDFIIIVGVILLNSVIGYWQELKAIVSTKALAKMTESRVNLLRDGAVTRVLSRHVVPGDIIVFSEGDVVPADVRLLETGHLMANEASVTGESLPVEKDAAALVAADALPYEWRTMALSGTTIVSGTGRGVAVRTGERTYFASIAEKVREESPASPLSRSLAVFFRRYGALVAVIIVIAVALEIIQGQAAANILNTLLGILVASIPEGLPLVVTMVLTIGAVSLSRRSALVKHLPAVETLGSATVIASDKTGTITEGKLSVRDVCAPEPDRVKLIAALCNEAEQGRGDPVDVALASWLGGDYDRLRREHRRVYLLPFDPKRRYMATVNEAEGGRLICIKGAFDVLKERMRGGAQLPLLEQAHAALAGSGRRVLAFAYAPGDAGDIQNAPLAFAGLVGFFDPPKGGVKEAVATARRAGIRTIMITGDNPLTAQAVAGEVGIWREGDRILHGKEISGLDDRQLADALPATTVLARVTPDHKYRIVKLLHRNGEIVAVTGDGVNDVPALKAASLGIAMGSGSEAAKATAKMIIVNNSLNVIVDTVRRGRVIADNVRKVIYYLITSSLSLIIFILLATITVFPQPLSALYVLWINLVTDGVQDKTFSFIREEGNVMRRPPKKPGAQFFDLAQVVRIVAATVVIAFVNLGLYTYMMVRDFSRGETVTTVFTSLVAAQWVNGILAQKENEPFFKNIRRSITINPYVWGSIVLGMLLQFLAVYAFGSWLGTAPIEGEHYALAGTSVLAVFVLIEAVSWVRYSLKAPAPGHAKPNETGGPVR